MNNHMSSEEIFELGKQAGRTAHELGGEVLNCVSPAYDEVTEGLTEEEIQVLNEGWDQGWDEYTLPAYASEEVYHA